MPGLVSVPRPVRIPPARLKYLTLLENTLEESRRRLKDVLSRDLDAELGATLKAVRQETEKVKEATHHLKEYLKAIEEDEARLAEAHDTLLAKSAEEYVEEAEKKVQEDVERNAESIDKGEKYLSTYLEAQKAREEAIERNAQELRQLEASLAERRDLRTRYEKDVQTREEELRSFVLKYEEALTQEKRDEWEAISHKLEVGQRKVAAFREQREKGTLGELSSFAKARLDEARRMKDVYSQCTARLSALLSEVYSLRQEHWRLKGCPALTPCQALVLQPEPTIYDFIVKEGS